MLGKLFVLGILVTAAYFAARRLIDDPALIGQLPEPARDPARKLRAQLIEVESMARDVMADVAREREAAENDLRTDYMSRTRRSADEPGWNPAN